MSNRVRRPHTLHAQAEETDPQSAALVQPLMAVSFFCDDMRLEASGKIILIGCYPGNIIVSPPSQMIDRLCVVSKMTWSGSFDTSGMRMRADIPALEPTFMNVQTATSATDDMSGVAFCVWHIRFPPLREGDCLRIHVECGGTAIQSGELRVVAPAQQAQPQTLH